LPGQHDDLKRELRAARSRAGITSDVALALQSGVHLQTIQNWMYGKTTPRPHELSKVANVLGVPMADLMAVYEGRNPEPPPLQDAIRELVEELRLSRIQQHEATMALLAAVGASIGPGRDHAGRPLDTANGPGAGRHSDRS
jgi:transcriptional regulator with XRE-family HTH domain